MSASKPKVSRRVKQREDRANPAEAVDESRFCKCFGYVSCSECSKDCLVDLNCIKLCCDCKRFLNGTCNCLKYCGCVSCL